MDGKPLVAITMGDPAGIGAEIVAKALSDQGAYDKCRPFVIGNAAAMDAAVSLVNAPLSARGVRSPEEVAGKPGVIDVLDLGNLDFGAVEPGKVSAVAGKASVEWILKACELASSGQIQAIATAPINKEACGLAGCKEIGHMEILQKQTGAREVATMLMAGNLRVVHLTTHRSLRVACDYATRPKILAKIRLTDEHFKRWGFPAPRIGVAALNPHASDGGLLGDEEEKEIGPAVEDARASGIDAIGPVPADTVFFQAIRGRYDAVLAMYHDQGHIPIKVHDFDRSVSVILGLPFIRTSVDHGTAFDIAGKGIAGHESMRGAIRVAADLARDSRLP